MGLNSSAALGPALAASASTSLQNVPAANGPPEVGIDVAFTASFDAAIVITRNIAS